MISPYEIEALLAVGAAVAWWQGYHHVRAMPSSLRRSRMLGAIWLLVAVAGAAVVILAGHKAVGLVFPPRIEWHVLDDREPAGIIQGSTSERGEVWVNAFSAKGRNISSSPIRTTAGFVRSDVTGVEIGIVYNINGDHRPPDRVSPIPPGSDFFVQVNFPLVTLPNETKHVQGIPESVFLSNYAPFTFEFRYDGETYKRTISRAYVEKVINGWKEKHRSRLSDRSTHMTAK